MRITDIQRFCMHDGPGVRTTVFFKGCPLRCVWCHNPETQVNKKELLVYDSKCIGCGSCLDCEQNVHKFTDERIVNRDLCVGCGQCAKNCPTNAIELVGEDITTQELFRQILKDIAFYGDNGGVTFSGGECMMQVDALEEILKMCKEKGIHTAVDTSGCTSFESFEKILPYTDLFLYDIKIFDNEKHKKYVGVSNELILNNLKKLFEVGAKIWIRIPIIPTVNDSVEEISKIKAFLDECGTPEKIELLPYHPMGESKRTALGQDTQVFETPTAEKMKSLTAIFN